MHGNGGPRHHAAAVNLQIFARGEGAACHVVQDGGFDALVILLPAVIGKRSDVVKNETIFLGIEFSGVVRIAAAPGCAIAVNQLAKGCVIGGLLLSASANESEQTACQGEGYVEKPTPAFATSSVCILHLQDHSPVADRILRLRGLRET